MVKALARPSPLARLRDKFRRPADLVLFARLGLFMWRAGDRLGSTELPLMLERVGSAPRPRRGGDPAAAVARIRRLRQVWFRLPALARYNTCFMRALTLYRFLDPAGADMRLHFVIEPRRTAGDRLRSHSWVTLDDVVVEEPDLRAIGVEEIFQHRFDRRGQAPG